MDRVSFSINKRIVYLSQEPPIITDRLPAKVYAVKFSSQTGYYLEEIETFELPTRVYGDLEKSAERIKTTFKDRKGTTGVLLRGEKGSGKTLLAKKLAIDLIAEGQPCLVVNAPFFGDQFSIFLQQIGQPLTIIFDEFEKVYTPEYQQGLLTLLDGVYPVKMLCILTSNSEKIADAMINRPGRIFYSLSYSGVSMEFIRDYANENLKDKSQVADVIKIAALQSFNFDQLKGLIEEMNRYDETAAESMKMINIKPPAGTINLWVESLKLNNQPIDIDCLLSKMLYVQANFEGCLELKVRTPNTTGQNYEQYVQECHDKGLDHYYEVREIRSLKADDILPFIPRTLSLVADDEDEEYEIEGQPDGTILFRGLDQDTLEPLEIVAKR